jgi:hypothetical protein
VVASTSLADESFDANKPLTLSVDSSQNGVGAVLMQSNGPVAYASKALTDTQQRWAQIEKELNAIVFGCERFHQYVYGKQVNVETDHKPLEILFKKPLSEVPMRLQRMMLKIQKYDLIVRWRPGKEMHVADALSRAFLDDIVSSDSLEQDIEYQVNAMFLSNVSVTPDKLEELKKETVQDNVLSKLKQMYYQGWPNKINEVEECLKPF